MSVMMKCGCASHAMRHQKDGSKIPCCTIHDCIEVADAAPSLEGRKARCAYCGQRPRKSECDQCKDGGMCSCERPSSTDLAFFSFQGEGSREATEICKACKMHKAAHVPGSRACRNFVPQGPLEFDKFYCGCAGRD